MTMRPLFHAVTYFSIEKITIYEMENFDCSHNNGSNISAYYVPDNQESEGR